MTLSFCFDIPEEKALSRVSHALLVQRSCVSWFSSLNDVEGLRMARCRTIQITYSAQGRSMKGVETFASTEGNNKNIYMCE